MLTMNEKDRYISDFAAFQKARNGRNPWLREIRQGAIARFADLGFPTQRNEDWKYTNVAPIGHTPFKPALHNGIKVRDAGKYLFGHEDCCHLVFVNGAY